MYYLDRMRKLTVMILLLLPMIFRFPDQVRANTVYPLRDMLITTEKIALIERKDVPWLIGFTGCAALLFIYDRQIMAGVQEIRSSALDPVMNVAQYGGDGWSALAGAGAVFFSGLFFENKRILSLGTYLLEGYALCGAYGQAVKFIAGRERPYAADNPYMFKPFTVSTRYASFYSGHSTTAFTMASIVSHYFKKPWVSVLAYTLAGLTGVQRMYGRKHWPSDVFVGAFAGILIGRSIVRENLDFIGLGADRENFVISFRIKKL